jgi:hypothetical protein
MFSEGLQWMEYLKTSTSIFVYFTAVELTDNYKIHYFPLCQINASTYFQNLEAETHNLKMTLHHGTVPLSPHERIINVNEYNSCSESFLLINNLPSFYTNRNMLPFWQKFASAQYPQNLSQLLNLKSLFLLQIFYFIHIHIYIYIYTLSPSVD